MCKHIKNVRRSQPCLSMNFCTESSSSMWESLNKNSIGYSTKRYKWFSKQLTIWKNDMFLCSEHLNVFNTLILKQIFKNLEYHFFVNSTLLIIKGANSPYKLILPEANIRPIQKIGLLQKTEFCLWQLRFYGCFFFQYKILFKELICCINCPNVHFHTFCKCLSFIWWYFFSLSILKRY